MGILRGYDVCPCPSSHQSTFANHPQVYLNVVLDDAIEERPGGEKLRLGMVVIRGNSVVMLEVPSPEILHLWKCTDTLYRPWTASTRSNPRSDVKTRARDRNEYIITAVHRTEARQAILADSGHYKAHRRSWRRTFVGMPPHTWFPTPRLYHTIYDLGYKICETSQLTSQIYRTIVSTHDTTSRDNLRLRAWMSKG